MADRIVSATQDMSPGLVVGVIGRTKKHAETLVELVKEIAAVRGLSVSHVEYSAIGADELAIAAAQAEAAERKETLQ